MYLNSYDEGRPFSDNEEVVNEYQILIDHIFDFVLDEEIGTDDFDFTAETLPDPSMDEAHEQISAIMDWIDAREAVSAQEVSLVDMMKKLQLGRKEKLLLWLLLLPQLSMIYARVQEERIMIGHDTVVVQDNAQQGDEVGKLEREEDQLKKRKKKSPQRIL